MPRRLASFALLVAIAIGLSACGSSGDSASSELAHQQELAAARKQAAQDARQSAHIEELKNNLKRIQRENRQSGETSTDDGPSSPPPKPASLGDWPGGSGYTAILASLPTEGEARVAQEDATGDGLDAGLLYSSNFSSLRPGYWVVFSGTFSDGPQAAARAERAHELGFSDAYPRFVAP